MSIQMPPSISTFTGTNYSPSHDQALVITRLLEAKQADLTRLEQEIERVAAILSQLTRQRDEARAYIASHTALLSPIRKIPIELLQEIFSYCPPPKERDFSGAPNPADSPLVLTRVCGQWRNVALETPQLWDTLLMRFPSFDVKEVSSQRLRLMEWWLERSKSVPLTLSVSVPIASWNVLADFLPLYRTHLPRCKELRLWLPNNWISHIFFIIGTAGTPLLERLEISFSSATGFAEQIPTIDLLPERIPRLRHFYLRLGKSDRIDLSAASRGLHSLDLDLSLTPSECRRLLVDCPNLVSCRFRAVDEWSETPSGTEITTTTMDRLEDLNIQISQPISPLLTFLTLPALKSLHIHESLVLDSDVHVWDQECFDAFVQRSGCRLNKLLLHNVLRNEDELVRCLSMCSSLVHFGVTGVHGLTLCTNRTLDMLTVKAGVPPVAPMLESLRLGSTLRSTDGYFAEMMRSRWGEVDGVARLLSVNPVWKLGEHIEDIRQLMELRLRGLDVGSQ